MSLFAVGRLCVKLAGRDAGKKCVVVELLDNRFVLVDGETRRRKVNVLHLEPLDEVLEISDKASHEEVAAAFSKEGLVVWKKKAKKVEARPKKQKKKKAKPVKDKKAVKEEKKSVKEVEEKKEVTEEVKVVKTEETKVAKESKAEKEVDNNAEVKS